MLRQGLSIRHWVVLFTIAFMLSLTVFNVSSLIKLPQSLDVVPVEQSDDFPIGKTQIIPGPEIISRWQLFGKSQSAVRTTPKSRLKIKLIGIISSTQNEHARVIISEGSGKQKYFKMGDKIKSNVSIKSIEADHIVIIHNNRDEVVPLNNNNPSRILIEKVSNQ
jgi:type II secretory pathway component PulC